MNYSFAEIKTIDQIMCGKQTISENSKKACLCQFVARQRNKGGNFDGDDPHNIL